METKKYLDTGYDGIFLEETGEGYILSARYAGCWGYSTGKGAKP